MLDPNKAIALYTGSVVNTKTLNSSGTSQKLYKNNEGGGIMNPFDLL